MKTIFRSVALAGLFAASASPALSGDLKLTLSAGRVTIIAQDVPVRQILAEWARVGKTTIVNADKLVGPSVTLQLIDAPESQALDILLRSASGYVVAQRASYEPGASVFDRVMIMPTSRPPAASASAPPVFNPPARNMAQPAADEGDDPADAPLVMPPGAQPVQQGRPQPGQMQNQPGMQNPQPLTAPRPGILPAPPGAPGTVRPPGGPGGGPGGEGA